MRMLLMEGGLYNTLQVITGIKKDMKRTCHYMNSFFDMAEYYEYSSSVVSDPAALAYGKDAT